MTMANDNLIIEIIKAKRRIRWELEWNKNQQKFLRNNDEKLFTNWKTKNGW